VGTKRGWVPKQGWGVKKETSGCGRGPSVKMGTTGRGQWPRNKHRPQPGQTMAKSRERWAKKGPKKKWSGAQTRKGCSFEPGEKPKKGPQREVSYFQQGNWGTSEKKGEWGKKWTVMPELPRPHWSHGFVLGRGRLSETKDRSFGVSSSKE